MTDALGYAQKAFGDSIDSAKHDLKPIRMESIIRRFLAYGLKGIAIFSGIAISSGVIDSLNITFTRDVTVTLSQFLGISVTVAIAIDSFFSNHEKMVATTLAAKAYTRMIKSVQREHTLKLTPILLAKSLKSKQAKQDLISLVSELTKRVYEECELIEKALDDMNLKALRALSLDSEKTQNQ